MITAVIMVGGRGGERFWKQRPVDWVRNARRAAAHDLVVQLAEQPLVEQILFVSPEFIDLEPVGKCRPILSEPGPIHVGRWLAELVRQFDIKRLLYFGGGSAPLLDNETLAQIVSRLAGADRLVITNNRFSSDWAAIAPADIIGDWVEKLPQDNMLGWVLSSEAGLPVSDFPASAASRLDIDTPVDLLTLQLHPQTKSHLRRFCNEFPQDTGRLQRLLGVLATPASHVLVAGRLGPAAWQAVNQATKCWIRVFSEERGMVSSGRQTRGEVFSFLADYVALTGPELFFEKLARQVQAALIDTRLLLAHHHRWPDEAGRFASDLGLIDQIEDEWLRQFTAAALTAPIPVLLGGHGLLAGDLFAFCEML